MLRDHGGEIVLIVSHSNTIAPLIDELHGSKRLTPFAPDEFNGVYIVTSPWYGKVKTLSLRYREPPRHPRSRTTRPPTSASSGSQSSRDATVDTSIKGFDAIVPSAVSGGYGRPCCRQRSAISGYDHSNSVRSRSAGASREAS